MARKNMKIKRSVGSRVFDVINAVFLTLLAFSTLYPFWDTLVVSFSSIKGYLSSSFHLWPKEWSLEAYRYMLKQDQLWRSYANTFFVTIVGTVLNMLITIPGAYVLSKKHLKGYRVIMFFITFTMMFTGGIIPLYLVVDGLGLKNSLWSMILPSAVNTFNLIVLRTFFFKNPEEIEESARIDGCNDISVLFRIVIPISKAGITTIAMYYAVFHWNDFMSAVMYITDKKKFPLQLFLRSMLFESDAAYSSGGESLFLLGQPMKMAAIMMAVLPIVLIYPWIQKYFTQGVTAGAVKG
jgi:putative aldouronate transport system permease protein